MLFDDTGWGAGDSLSLEKIVADITLDRANERRGDFIERPTLQRYWVVRAQGGHYYDMFINHSLISISHINGLNFSDAHPFLPEVDVLQSRMKTNYVRDAKTKAAFTSHFHQVISFIFDMKVGDLVLTVSDTEIRIGRIIGNPKIVNTSIVHYYDETNQKTLNHKLRRGVAWGPAFKRKDLPFAVTKSLRANQAVFNIDEHWELIYHLLYPVFRFDNKLYISCNITQRKAINNYAMSIFLQTLSELELAAKSRINNISNELIIERIISNKINDQDLTLTTKAQFFSPGTVWGVLHFAPEHASAMTDFAAAYLSLMSSGAKDTNYHIALTAGALGLVGMAKYWPYVRESLQPQIPHCKTDILEDDSNDEGPFV
ncbi:hypothetical protein KP001_09880 [Geomonas subterranea]|uniref:Uncharacterized protein n=1 Tax=Geomonas subterranea TaxID=2847989 RepID=A0ABX8LRB6_9BACT|nr:hypothetical protein [Geomonas subterranea]QXE92798.1 hypothetical protein KP001_09880 [Geomonas subterranea]QXM09099.1 hypothetical protein KP002_19395 [Geomonas subterranea]